MTAAISSIHDLVRKAEVFGLNQILTSFLARLSSNSLLRQQLADRTVGDWLTEWKSMHGMLFQGVFRVRGCWRSEQVRFGTPGDEELHKIPQVNELTRELSVLARTVSDGLSVEYPDLAAKCTFLAQAHYQFIRIHPFKDGNGRIARAITDQLAVSLGLIPAIAGYPRNNAEKKVIYHSAIRACVGDAHCTQLSKWIQEQIETKSQELA
jgi:cell filamentation protein